MTYKKPQTILAALALCACSSPNEPPAPAQPTAEQQRAQTQYTDCWLDARRMLPAASADIFATRRAHEAYCVAMLECTQDAAQKTLAERDQKVEIELCLKGLEAEI